MKKKKKKKVFIDFFGLNFSTKNESLINLQLMNIYPRV